MTSEKISFIGSHNQTLSARIDYPEGETKAYAIFAHCFSLGKDMSTINRISKGLNAENIALFRFDFTGLGMSEGEFSNTNFSSNVQDLLDATLFMRENLSAPDVMIGHSLGGTAALVAGSQLNCIKAVATIGSPFDTINVLKHFKNEIDIIMEQGEAEVSLGGRPFKIKKQFIEDAQNQDIEKAIKDLKKPLMIMHSPIDETVSIEHARKIYQAAFHPKSFISLDKADHLLLKESKYSNYVAKVLAAWASQYI